MDFTYDDEQVALRDATRTLLAKTYSDYEARRRTVREDPGFDREVWGRMAEMGLLGLLFDEADGGVGAGPVEAAIVAQEIGRVLAPEPYLTSMVAGSLVAAVGSPTQRAALIGDLAEGSSLVALAHDEPGQRWTASARGVVADDAGRLSGVKDGVLHGDSADVLLVTAAVPSGGTGVFVVSGDALAGTTRTAYTLADGSRGARVVLDGTEAEPLGSGDDAEQALARALDLGRVLAANEALGTMQSQLAATTDYLKSRRQFGVTLNTFQALTFRAADMYTSLELTHSMVDWATMVAAEGAPEALADAAARVGLQVSRAGRHVGQEAIQLHGGIGMTAEYRVGAGTARLTVLDHLHGDGGAHLRALDAAGPSAPAPDPLGVVVGA